MEARGLCASRVLLSGATRASVPVRRHAAWPDQGSLWCEASLGAREPLAQLRQFFVEEPRRFFVDRCEPINPGDRDRAVCDERRDCAVNVGAVALEHHAQVFNDVTRVTLFEFCDGVLNKQCHRVMVHALTLAGVLLCRQVAHARLA